VTVTPDPTDRRVRTVRPTPAGRRERRVLDRRSDAFAAGLLEPLNTHERTRLTNAMRDVERLLMRARTSIREMPATHADVRWCFGRYYAELDERFENGFEVRLARRTDPADLTPPRGLVLIASLGDEPVGCGALRSHDDGVAEIKRLWVAPHVRGVGLGGRLLAELESRARSQGSRVARLDTNRALTEAIAMYRRSGYREVPAFNDERYAHHWFEKPLDDAPDGGPRVSWPHG
jgi:ribosomal protein S18 acetylase RimI-like enzyme